MSSTRATLASAFAALLLAAASLSGTVVAAPAGKLLVGYQDSTLPEIATASKIFDDAPYKLEWVILPGPASQLSALYSKGIDVAHLGDTSLIIEQGRSNTAWTEETVPAQIVAGWRNPDAKFPRIVTAVRTRAGVTTLADLKGKKWGFNFGGLNYLQYVFALRKAGLTLKDIEPIQFGDGNAAVTAFNSDRTEVYSGVAALIGEAVEKGQARIVLTNDDLEIPGLGVFAARRDVIRDAARSEVLNDFLIRLGRYWTWYAANLDTVEKVYVEKIKQSAARARYYVEFGQGRFQPIDDDLIRREQNIADILAEIGTIQKKIDVDIEFSRKYNAATAAVSN